MGGRLMSQVGYIFNLIFAPQYEESNQGACEQDYQAVGGIGLGLNCN